MKHCALAVSLLLNPVLLYHTYKLLHPTKVKQEEETEVLFWPDKGIQCPRFGTMRGCLDKKCHFTHSLTSQGRLEALLRSATSSLDICMFVVSAKSLVNIVLDLNSKGIIVRVITDNQDSNTVDNGEIKSLRAAGIPIRSDNSDYLMHHKFVIIDKVKVLTGSYNWSKGGQGLNRENVIVVGQRDTVDVYNEEFSKMWDLYQGGALSVNMFNEKVNVSKAIHF